MGGATVCDKIASRVPRCASIRAYVAVRRVTWVSFLIHCVWYVAYKRQSPVLFRVAAVPPARLGFPVAAMIQLRSGLLVQPRYFCIHHLTTNPWSSRLYASFGSLILLWFNATSFNVAHGRRSSRRVTSYVWNYGSQSYCAS